MATLQIHSNNTDDLYLLNEMARRMNLKTELKRNLMQALLKHNL
jgi:hypothetical protein